MARICEVCDRELPFWERMTGECRACGWQNQILYFTIDGKVTTYYLAATNRPADEYIKQRALRRHQLRNRRVS